MPVNHDRIKVLTLSNSDESTLVDDDGSSRDDRFYDGIDYLRYNASRLGNDNS